jgi:hypothetical protein
MIRSGRLIRLISFIGALFIFKYQKTRPVLIKWG